MLDPGLPTRPLEPNGVPHGLVVDHGDIVRPRFGRPLGHERSVGRDSDCTMLHTVQPMALPGRDIQRESFLERGLLGIGDRIGLLAGVVLAVSAFTGWYAGPSQGVKVSVTGWDTGLVGKVVFFIGLAVVLVIALREIGVDLPAAVPESLVTIVLGAAATIIVLVRVISIPDDFFFAGRGVGIWISLVAAIGVIVAGLLQASEEL